MLLQTVSAICEKLLLLLVLYMVARHPHQCACKEKVWAAPEQQPCFERGQPPQEMCTVAIAMLSGLPER